MTDKIQVIKGVGKKLTPQKEINVDVFALVSNISYIDKINDNTFEAFMMPHVLSNLLSNGVTDIRFILTLDQISILNT